MDAPAYSQYLPPSTLFTTDVAFYNAASLPHACQRLTTPACCRVPSTVGHTRFTHFSLRMLLYHVAGFRFAGAFCATRVTACRHSPPPWTPYLPHLPQPFLLACCKTALNCVSGFHGTARPPELPAVNTPALVPVRHALPDWPFTLRYMLPPTAAHVRLFYHCIFCHFILPNHALVHTVTNAR